MHPQHPQGLQHQSDPLSRLSEQTLLVEKLSAQKEQGERAILTLKSDIQRLVCGAGNEGPGAGVLPWACVRLAQGSLPTEIPAQWQPAGSG